jgi:hypothetical protein
VGLGADFVDVGYVPLQGGEKGQDVPLLRGRFVLLSPLRRGKPLKTGDEPVDLLVGLFRCCHEKPVPL